MIFLTPSWLKKAKHLNKGVRKFVQYNSDLMPPEKIGEIEEMRLRYLGAVRTRNQAEAEAIEKDLVKACEKSVPEYRNSPLKENIEVIIVAIVVALGIRAYFVQPFKIPTASMYPTLNGIVGTRMKADEAFPNPVVRALQFVTHGRNYVDARIPAEWGDVQLVGMGQKSKMHFFSSTELTFVDRNKQQRTLSIYAPARTLVEDLWSGPVMRLGADGASAVQRGVESFQSRAESGIIPAGTLLARGHVDTGDQVLVDKVSYHFRTPTRGEVFVFSTAGITGITPPPGIDSQHYIKRLTGVPGDKLKMVHAEPSVTASGGTVRPGADLWVNGAPAAEFGMKRVMARKDGYFGYTMADTRVNRLDPGGPFMNGEEEVTLGPESYMAMGDNSANSFDSRAWGPVPERNLVGPALIVYWPFLPHFGFIR